MQHFSLAIIGSGSGNNLVSKDQAQGPVALIESGVFGGTCLNRGCIPSKILVHTADLATEVRRASDFGIDAELTGLDWRSIRDRTFSKIDRISAAGRQFRVESDRVTLFEGRARFAGPYELVIDGETRIRADRIVLATGKLLGAHILGYQASLLIQPLVQAMSTGQSVASMARGQYWIHPALSEVVENALLKLPAQWTGS